MQSIPPNVSVEKASILHGQGRLSCYSRQLKMKLNFIKKEELEENSNYSFKPIEDVKLRSTEKKNSCVL